VCSGGAARALICFVVPLSGRFALAAALLVGCSGCSEGSLPQKPPLEVVVKITSDPGRPVDGAEILFNGKPIAKTDPQGAAKLVLQGKEGESYEVTVRCPPGYQSPTKGLLIPLHRLTDPSKPPEYEVSCPPTKRSIVVVVRAENGANLPVMYLGRAVGHTDASGAATVLLKDVDADAQFDLTLDTTEKGNEGLRPQNPSASFTVKRADDVFAFDVKFTVEAKAKVFWVGPKKEGPVKLPTKVNP
jgi:hypothetical protein